MSEFDNVHPALAEALSKRGYEQLTPVQQAVLQTSLSGEDMLVSAQTGSGKTVAFGLAVAATLLGDDERFAKAKAPLALAVAPTRELALQVKRELEWLYAETGAVITSCVGGMDIRTERRALERGAHIVVGTPGRLRDHISRSAFDTSTLAAVVLDEADEMLDLGFREDLEFILESTPEERQTLLFSATVPPMIGKLAQRYQRDAVRVTTAEEKKQHADIDYRALVVAPREKENAIINVLRFYEAENALVFCNTRASVNHMVSRFNNRGFSVVALSGELTQSERNHALQAMRDGRARVCIATDVAARGIDLPNLELVIHADLPSNPETLLHRSGRTGRAGRKGVSALMVEARGRSRAERLLRFAKLNAEWGAPPSADDVHMRDEERLFADSIFTDAITEDEQSSIEKLSSKFSLEQIAAAFLRQNKAGKSAPEDIQILDVDAPQKRNPRDKKERPEKQFRNEFENSVWVSLSVGRKQRAEPRWLIPMICKAGGINKRAIGAIKMQGEDTLVQLDAKKAELFFDTIGPNQILEKNIRATRLNQEPEFDDRFEGKPNKRSNGAFSKNKGKNSKREKFTRHQEDHKPPRAEKFNDEKKGKKGKAKTPHRGQGQKDIFQENSAVDFEAGTRPSKPKKRKAAPKSGGPDAVLTGKPKKPFSEKREPKTKNKSKKQKKAPKGS